MNTSSALAHCWHEQSCHPCLHSRYPCSWCAASSTCVANPAHLHLLAPIFHPDICPLKDERWELRTQLLGCKVSTLTYLSVLVSVGGTLLAIFILYGLVRFTQWAWHRRIRARIALHHYYASSTRCSLTGILRLRGSIVHKANGKSQDSQVADERPQLLA